MIGTQNEECFEYLQINLEFSRFQRPEKPSALSCHCSLGDESNIEGSKLVVGNLTGQICNMKKPALSSCACISVMWKSVSKATVTSQWSAPKSRELATGSQPLKAVHGIVDCKSQLKQWSFLKDYLSNGLWTPRVILSQSSLYPSFKKITTFAAFSRAAMGNMSRESLPSRDPIASAHISGPDMPGTHEIPLHDSWANPRGSMSGRINPGGPSRPLNK